MTPAPDPWPAAHLPASYVLADARVPAGLLAPPFGPADAEGLVALDIAITDGRIAALARPGGAPDGLPRLPLAGRLALPGLIDIHTHLDKGFIWPRAPNPDGSFEGAVRAVLADRTNWNEQDIARRFDFALRCAYAHGTVAIRTHLDSDGEPAEAAWRVFAQMRDQWAGRIDLQAVGLMPIERMLDEAATDRLIALVREHGGRLGTYTYVTPHLDAGLERLFDAAERFGLALDLHVDERDSEARALHDIAAIARRRRFEGPILAGHCCALALKDDAEIDRTLDLVAQAGIAVVALPLCNLYLQDRIEARTPRWRGITLLHEMAARGIEVMVGSDNTRDPFYAYGDLDLVEVWREASRIAHLDHPFGDWPAIIARTPARHMGVAAGTLAIGARADLILFTARSLNELLARPQGDRIVLREGKAIDRTLPDYGELDDLMAPKGARA
ncbi:cytosine deaminase [Angulomicrobium tetraedrale]|uniref:Cytosine deaminase n=1 Tax=Ancylobacter tetraedralis TaxID=217068 RepID=A0A839ZC95_9HYPH|nr:cytosine deaminase [Ancylobacter tetraedralis]MBB3772315.1 cytosine deaminase [Ancylobacter tetraedralis]